MKPMRLRLLCLSLVVHLGTTCVAQSNKNGAESSASSEDVLTFSQVSAARQNLSSDEENRYFKNEKFDIGETAFRLHLCYANSKHWVIESYRWLVVAAENNLPVATSNLGMYYQEYNMERSKYWLERALSLGETTAKDRIERLNSLLSQRDPAEVAANEKKNQESHHLSAADESKLLTEAKLGNAESACRLGRYYRETKKWKIEGNRWLVEAAEAGNGEAACYVALAYFADYPEADTSRAKHWLQKSVKAGYVPAKEELRKLDSLGGKPAPQNGDVE